MCCFSGGIDRVADTSIFARGAGDRQFLVYGMSYAAPSELAMVLPLPVPPGAGDEAVRFISLERYPEFFDDLRSLINRHDETTFGGSDSKEAPQPRLKVHDVGGFEASFVPGAADFGRLDERFRISSSVLQRLPGCADYGFAVFKLKQAGNLRRVHPMALDFPRRHADRLFFPTIHVHDGEVHDAAEFDHLLYCQGNAARRITQAVLDFHERLDNSRESELKASQVMDSSRTAGIVDPDARCSYLRLEGRRRNVDTFLHDGFERGTSVLPALLS